MKQLPMGFHAFFTLPLSKHATPVSSSGRRSAVHRANRQKPSGIAAKETIGRMHLQPHFGAKRLDAVTTEQVHRLKHTLTNRAPKTDNNVSTVLNVVLRKAAEVEGAGADADEVPPRELSTRAGLEVALEEGRLVVIRFSGRVA